jgi:hypothetical protein
MIRRCALPLILSALAIVSACGKKSPTEPTTTTTSSAPTRIMRLEANLEFGSVPVGQTSERDLRIYNEGNSAMTITGMTVPSGSGSAIVATWTNGIIQPRTSQLSVIRFTPTTTASFSGTLTVNGDQTSGSNTTPISGVGQRDLFRRSGSGAFVFDMPLDVARIHVVATYGGFCENFIVRIGNRAAIINEILGTCSVGSGPRYEATLLTGGGGTVSITNSTGISWLFEEVR